MDPIFWSFLLLGFGVAFIILEIFLPSAGLLGMLAGCFTVAGLIFAFMHGVRTGAVVTLGTVIAIPLLFAAAMKVWPHTPIGKMILLKDLTSADVMPNNPQYSRMTELLGRLGVAKSEMIPSGQIVIDGEKFDAISNAFPIDAGTPIKVVAVNGNRIYVEAHDGEVAAAEDLPVRDRDVLSTPIKELGIDLSEDEGTS